MAARNVFKPRIKCFYVIKGRFVSSEKGERVRDHVTDLALSSCMERLAQFSKLTKPPSCTYPFR
jgi:hypothetical protein